MAILSRTEVKTYLQITSTDYDTLIDAYIPLVLEDFFEYTNNYFHNNKVRLYSGLFTVSSSGTITVTGTNFSTYSFASGDEIHIFDSVRNDGFYTAATVSSATITLSTADTVKGETQETDFTIVKMEVPDSIKPVLASMIKYRIDSPMGNAQSESLGDYSVTYGPMPSGYPQGIQSNMNKYKCLRFT